MTHIVDDKLRKVGVGQKILAEQQNRLIAAGKRRDQVQGYQNREFNLSCAADGGNQQGTGLSEIFRVAATETLPARSGSTPGFLVLTRFELVSGSLVTTGSTETVYNLSEAPIVANVDKYIVVDKVGENFVYGARDLTMYTGWGDDSEQHVRRCDPSGLPEWGENAPVTSVNWSEVTAHLTYTRCDEPIIVDIAHECQ